MKRNNHAGAFLIFLGLLLFVAAGGLYIHNHLENQNAGTASDHVLVEMIQKQEIEERQRDSTQVDTQIMETADTDLSEMEETMIDGYAYIGYLSIPELELNLPVMSELDYARLRIAPCRQSGSIGTNNLVIAAHNYDRHFGRLSKLSSGDTVLFTDVNGNEFPYSVFEVVVCEPTEESVFGTSADLTLYTCTYGGANRVVVRCSRPYCAQTY